MRQIYSSREVLGNNKNFACCYDQSLIILNGANRSKLRRLCSVPSKQVLWSFSYRMVSPTLN